MIASPEGVKKLKIARNNIGWNLDDETPLKKASKILQAEIKEETLRRGHFAYGVSLTTWKRFLYRRQPIRTKTFKAFCEVLGLSWEEVAEIKTNSDIPPDRPPYINREDEERKLIDVISQPECFIRLKGPEKMGKSSLLKRVLEKFEQKDNYLNLTVDFLLINTDEGLEEVFKEFCQIICREMCQQKYNIRQPNESKSWNENLTAKYATQCYFKSEILDQIDINLVLILKNADVVFGSKIANKFCQFLRSWYGKWEKLRLIITHSTDVYAQLDINSSPLSNVGEVIELDEFTPEQIKVLVNYYKKKYQLNLKQEEIEQLKKLVGGHPFLLHKALKHIADGEKSLSQILETAHTQQGIYKNHLNKCLDTINKQKELRDALLKISANDKPIKISQKADFKLDSMGLVKREGNDVTYRNLLYRKYFREQLENPESNN